MSRSNGTAGHPKNTRPAMEFVGGNIMGGGAVVQHTALTNFILLKEGCMDKSTKTFLITICCHLPEGWRWNKGRHLSKTMIPNTRKLSSVFQRKKWKLLEWPSQSVDRNPIENLWKELKIKVHRGGPQKNGQCTRLVYPYRRRLEPTKAFVPSITFISVSVYNTFSLCHYIL